MKVMMFRYGIGRGRRVCNANHNAIAEELSKHCRLLPIYVYNDYQHTFSDNPGLFQLFRKNCWTARVEKGIEQSKQYADVHNDNYASMNNLFQQFEMLAACYFLALSKEPDFIIFLRDDILINQKSLITTFQKVTELNTVWFSAFHGNNGYCERFGILPFSKAMLLNRYKYISDYYNSLNGLKYTFSKGMNGEWLYRYIIDMNCTNFVCSYVLSQRVRDPDVVVRERVIPRPWHFHTECKILGGVKRYYLRA